MAELELGDSRTALIGMVAGLVFWGVVGVLIVLRSKPERRWLRAGAGILLGAMLSNAFDYVVLGGVRNMLQMLFTNPLSRFAEEGINVPGFYAKHPAFSLAAVAIWAGTLILLAHVRIGKKEPETPPPPPPEPGKRPPPEQRKPGGSRPQRPRPNQRPSDEKR